MSHANQDGKPYLDTFERQRAIMQDLLKTVPDLLKPVIVEIEEEGVRLNYLEAEYQQAELRGENPDPGELARVRTAQAALIQRGDKLSAHMQAMGQQLEAITHAANECVFEYLRRQFNAQFNTKEGL